MAKYNLQIGVQTYSLHKTCDNTETTIEATKKAGLDVVELCQTQLDVFACADIEGEVKKYQDAGITISSCGCYGVGTDEEEDRKIFEFAKIAGFKAISCGVPWDGTKKSLELSERLADEYDVNLALHNHGRRHKLGSKWMRDDILAAASPRIGLCLDVGWLLDSGEDPVETVAEYYDRMYGLHLRDCTFGRDGEFIDVILGTGNLDIKGLMTLLKERNYQEYASIEYAGPAEDPAQAVKERADALKAVLQSLD